MHEGVIIDIPSVTPDFPSGKARLFKADSHKYVVIQPGLGADVSESKSTTAILGAIRGRCNVVLADHPGYGVNRGMIAPEEFTLNACKAHSLHVLLTILGMSDCNELFTFGTSLGAYTIKEALSQIWDPRIKLNLAKSAIARYQSVAQRLGGVEHILEKIFPIQSDGLCHLTVNPGDKLVRVHPSFIREIPSIFEFTGRLWCPSKAWHGTKDRWGTVAEAQEQYGSENVTVIDAGHDLTPEVDGEVVSVLLDALGISSVK